MLGDMRLQALKQECRVFRPEENLAQYTALGKPTHSRPYKVAIIMWFPVARWRLCLHWVSPVYRMAGSLP